MSVNIKPLGERIVILPAQAQERTPGGIWLPAQAQETQQKGVIVATGPGKFVDFAPDGTPRYEPMNVQVGTTVLYSKYAGSKIETDGVEYEVHTQGSLIAVLPSAETFGVENAENAIPSAFAGAI